MISFKEFLQEKMTAGVYVNANKELHVISDLVKKEFGISFQNLNLTCLASQFLFALESVSGISAQDLADAVDVESNYRGGITLAELHKLYNNTDLKLKSGKTVKFKLSTEVYNTKDAIKMVKTGQPVVGVFSYSLTSEVDYHLDDDTTDRIAPKKVLKDKYHKINKSGNSFHSLLLFGYDEGEGTLLLRDSRSLYGGGYIKMIAKDLRPSNVKWIATVVDDFKVIK